MRPCSLIRAALLALSILYSPTILAVEETPYPVWWSPELKLESLDLIDAELTRKFPRGDQFHLVTFALERVYTDALIDPARPELGYNWDIKRRILKERWIEYCRSLIEWTDKGFGIDQDSRYRVHAQNMRAIYSARCYALLALKQARPATTSYLRDFVLGQDVMSYIPPMIGRGWDCRSLDKFLKKNQDGVSWVDYYEDLYKKFNYRHEVTVLDENTAHVELLFRSSTKYSWSVHGSVKLTIYGRGDFNGDGLDDLLIKWDSVPYWRRGDPAASNSAVYIATRYKRDDVLRVVDFLGPPPTGIVGDCTYARKYIIESGRPE